MFKYFLALLMCPNVFWPVYVAILLMALQSAGRLLKEETSGRQVPLPAVSQVFHFSNRTWKYMAGWWKGVERETWVKADLSIIFSFSISDFILYEKADDFECKYTFFFSSEDLWLVQWTLITDSSITLEWKHPPRLIFELVFMAAHLCLPWSPWTWTCCFFTIRSALWSFVSLCFCGLVETDAVSHPRAAHTPLTDRLMHIANTKWKELDKITRYSDSWKSGVHQSTWKQSYVYKVRWYSKHFWGRKVEIQEQN